MQNKCLADSIVYQATVTTHDKQPKQTYVVLRKAPLKQGTITIKLLLLTQQK